MKARIEGKTYPVNLGWELIERQDEEFDTGSIVINSILKQPFPAYSYVELVEDKSVLEFVTGSEAKKTADTGLRDIKIIYIDVDIKDITNQQNLIDLSLNEGREDYIEIQGRKIKVHSEASGLLQESITEEVLSLGRQKIIVALIDTQFEIYINGIKQPFATGLPVPKVDQMNINKFSFGQAAGTRIGTFDIYEVRMASIEYTEDVIEKLANGNVLVDNTLIPENTEFIYNEFQSLTDIENTGYLFSVLDEYTLSGTNLTGTLATRFAYFTANTSSEWFDREFGVYEHIIPLIELTEWFTKLTTSVIRFTQPIDKTLPLNYLTLKSMTDRVYDVMFTELVGVNLGFQYTTELENELSSRKGYDYTFPEGNLWTVLSAIFKEFNGIPRIVSITNGKILLGVDYKMKETGQIEFDDYDQYRAENPSKDYGTMGESRGLNVVNDGEDVNNSSYMYTPDTLITIRSDGTVIDEDDMIHELFYPIKGLKSVIFIEPNTPANTVDITKFVVLQSVWDTLPSTGFVSGTTDLYKQNTIRYQIGGDTIYGWGKTYNRVFLPDFVVWRELIKSAQNDASVPVLIPVNFELVGIKVNYVPIVTQSLIRVAKEDISNVKRASVMSTAQGGNIVDLKRLGTGAHSDVQRSANRIYNYSKKVNKEIQELYKIGNFDTITRSIITIRKIIGYQDNYLAQYELHQDYEKITENLDISAKIRQFPIPEDGKSVESVRFYEDFIEWNLEGNEENTSSLTVDGMEAFMRTFGKSTALDKIEVDNVEIVSSEIKDDSGVQVNIIAPIVADGYRGAMKFRFGFKDPTFAYSRKIADGTLEIKQGIRYTDEEGFLDEFNLLYGKKYATTLKADADQLPIVGLGNYTGNPLISIGDVQQLLQNIPLPDVDFKNESGLPRIIRTENIGANVNELIQTSLAHYLFTATVESGVPVYDTLEVGVWTVDSVGISSFIGLFQITPGTPIVIPINSNISNISFYTDINVLQDGIQYKITTSYDAPLITTGNGIKLSKDAGEILTEFSYFLHNVFNQNTVSDIGNIIIGDEAMIGNILCGGVAKDDVTDLFVYESDRYNKNEKTNVKGTKLGAVTDLITFEANSITVIANITEGKSWAMGDSNGKLLFAVNPPRAINEVLQPVLEKVSFKGTHFRTGLVREY